MANDANCAGELHFYAFLRPLDHLCSTTIAQLHSLHSLILMDTENCARISALKILHSFTKICNRNIPWLVEVFLVSLCERNNLVLADISSMEACNTLVRGNSGSSRNVLCFKLCCNTCFECCILYQSCKEGFGEPESS